MQTEIAHATLKAVRRSRRATDRGSRKLAAATGLTPAQLLVLREVEARDEVTPGSIAQRLQFSHATITAIADRLVALGLVTRTRSDRDRSEEHTSELQSLMRISYAVFCLKKKKHARQKGTTTRAHTIQKN